MNDPIRDLVIRVQFEPLDWMRRDKEGFVLTCEKFTSRYMRTRKYFPRTFLLLFLIIIIAKSTELSAIILH